MSAAPLCFLDTETDGVHPDRKVWEVAAIRRDPDGTETTFSAFARINLATADPFGLRIGGFYERHPRGRVLAGEPREATARAITNGSRILSRREVANEVARITHGAHIIGAVPNFDTEVLDDLLRSKQIVPAWHYHLVDVENLAIGYLAGKGTPIAPPWDSNAITAALGLDPVPDDERHTALGDTRWAMRVYDTVMAGAAR